MPCRVSGRRRPGVDTPSRQTVRTRLGNQGTGASTMLVASPLATRWRSRFSTKMPWFGRAAFGNSVENVSSRIGHRAASARASGALRQIIQQLLGEILLLELGLVGDNGLQRLFGRILVAAVIQRHRVVVEDARIAAAAITAGLAQQRRAVFGLPLVVRIQPSVSAVCGLGAST